MPGPPKKLKKKLVLKDVESTAKPIPEPVSNPVIETVKEEELYKKEDFESNDTELRWFLNPIYLSPPFHIRTIMNVGITMELVNRLNSFRHYYIFLLLCTQSKIAYRNAKDLWVQQCAKKRCDRF